MEEPHSTSNMLWLGPLLASPPFPIGADGLVVWTVAGAKWVPSALNRLPVCGEHAEA